MSALKRIVLTWLATARGGAEKSSFELCQTIRRRYQVEVTLVLWHYGAAFDFGALTEGGAGEVIHCYDGEAYRRRLDGILAVDPGSTALFSNHRAYLVDLHLARRRGVKLAALFRETPLAQEALRALPSPTSSELVYQRGGELDWAALGRADALIGVSDFGVDGIARFAPRGARVVRIYNGPSLPDALFPIEPRAARRFLMVSRLIGWKAVDFGIRAFDRFRRRNPGVSLQIAGDGEEEAALRRLARRHGLDGLVEFLGFQEDIRRVYQANDCLLHVSGIESFGRVIIEAAACGLPAVVPQCGGPGELVVNGHTGFTFRPGDESDCLQALERAYRLGDAEYARVGSTARGRAQTFFNSDRMAEEYVGLANSMLVS
jgi:glycosyltransferase involved in cell wall biosynthesis